MSGYWPLRAVGSAKVCAVVGSPVSHSLSPTLHQAAYRALGLTDWGYLRCEASPDQLEQVVQALGAPPGPQGPVPVGLSVTMPHKQAVVPLLDAVDPLATVVGAVNTVVAQRAGRQGALLTGFNTDVAGIVAALREGGGTVPGPRRALVLGSGATACSALAALSELGATDITVAARRHAGASRALGAAHRMGLGIETLTWAPGKPDSDAQVAAVAAVADLVVSTLPPQAADPLAMALETAPPARSQGALLDVVYDPWPTPLARAWSRRGAAVAPGWLMLLHQAGEQVRLMTGLEPPLAVMRAALERALAS